MSLLYSKLGALFPGDYAPYSSFLEKCRTTQKDFTHNHHILPKKQFPEYELCNWNLILLSPEEHVHAHLLLEACSNGAIKSPASLFIKSGAGWSSATVEQQADRGRKSWEKFTPAQRSARVRKIILSQSVEQRTERARVGAKACWSALTFEQRNNKMIKMRSALTPEQRRTAGLAGGTTACHMRWHVKRNIISQSCKLCAMKKEAVCASE